MKNVRVSVDTYSYDTTDADPDDSWDRPDTALEINGYHAAVVDTKADEKSYYWNDSIVAEIDDDSDEVYVVVVRYSTGDTFGHDDGQVYLADAFDDEQDAYDLRDEFKKHDHSYDRRAVVPFNFEYRGKSYDIPWAGYFENLEGIHVETVKIS